jgi:cytochrome P450
MNTASPLRPPVACPGPSDPLDISFAGNLLDRLAACWREYGDCFVARSPAVQGPVYVLCHPDYAKHVLVTRHANYTKGFGIDRVRILLGNGLMASEGTFWHRQRRMIQPGFHRATLTRLAAHMAESNHSLVKRWADRARTGRPVSVTVEISEMTLDLVLHALFSEDLAGMMANGGNPFSILTDDTTRNLQFARKFRALGTLIGETIERRLRDERMPEDLLTLLLHARDRKSGQPMSRRELTDEVMTLIVAGHETTASALNWLWYLVSQHPGVAQRLREDVLARPPEAVDIPPADSYTTRVIRETLRLYPPGWLITKRAKAEDRIGPYTIPASAEIFVPVYLVHRHPDFWTAPESFSPDRFADGEPRDRYAYLPFSEGPRACIGDGFALLEMEIHVRAVARALRLDCLAGQKVELEPQINLRTRHGLSFQPVLR